MTVDTKVNGVAREERIAELRAQLDGFAAEGAAADAELARRQELADEYASLTAEAVEEERAVRRAEAVAAAAAIQEGQRKALEKAGRLLGQLEKLWRGELVENAVDLTALRVGSAGLFDEPGSHKGAMGEPLTPFPADFRSFVCLLADAAASEQIRRGKLLPEGLLGVVPDLRAGADEPLVQLSGVDGFREPRP